MSTVHYDGKCKRLETAIYGSFLLGVVATQKYIYTTDWVSSEKRIYNIWKTNKVTGKSSQIELGETTQPQGIGYFVDQYNGNSLSLYLLSLYLLILSSLILSSLILSSLILSSLILSLSLIHI